MFTGCGTAIVTPFRQDLSVDEAALRRLVNRQIDAGIDFLVPCGTTGESPTLTKDEHVEVVRITVDETRGRIPVLAGAGGYNTAEVTELIAHLKRVGVAGILSVTPYYNKPTQEGLYQHFRAIAESTDMPVVLYSVQPRTAVNIEPSTVLRLSEIPNIVGIKEASGSISQMAAIAMRVPDRFIVLSGDDSVTIPLTSLGGRGVISVVANQIPGDFADLAHAAVRGDFAHARQLQRRYQELMEINFIETSPGPVKYALHKMGLIELAYRLPLVPPQAGARTRIDAVLESLGLLSESVAGARA